jgi:hypothetical protein
MGQIVVHERIAERFLLRKAGPVTDFVKIGHLPEAKSR